MFYSCKKSISKKNPVLPIKKFPSLVLARNAIIPWHLIIQFPLYYQSSGHLWEVKNKNFQTISSKSGCGRLREMVAYKRFHIFRLYLETFGILEKWLQSEIPLYLNHQGSNFLTTPPPPPKKRKTFCILLQSLMWSPTSFQFELVIF